MHCGIVKDVSDACVHSLVCKTIGCFRLSLLSICPSCENNACEIVRQVAVALQYVHEQGFVHRDVKPSNIMLSIELKQPVAEDLLERLFKRDGGRPIAVEELR